MPSALDLWPRILLHAPGGDVVLDPFASGTAAPGTVVLGGITIPYEVVFGPVETPPGGLLTDTASSLGLMLLVIGGAWWLARRR